MRSLKNIIYLIIFITIIIVSCIVIFTINNPQKKQIKLSSTIIENDSITQNYKVKLNNKEVTVPIKFTYEFNEQLETYYIKGNINDSTLVYYNKSNNKDSIFNKEELSKQFTNQNFKVLKGKDNKEYLAIISNNQNFDSNYTPEYLYIINDNLDLIMLNDMNLMIKDYNIKVKVENEKIWYKDTFNICQDKNNCKIMLKIENNKIYNLVINPESTLENDLGTIEERIYTISNNKLEYNIKNTYKIVGSYGEGC